MQFQIGFLRERGMIGLPFLSIVQRWLEDLDASVVMIHNKGTSAAKSLKMIA